MLQLQATDAAVGAGEDVSDGGEQRLCTVGERCVVLLCRAGARPGVDCRLGCSVPATATFLDEHGAGLLPVTYIGGR